MYMEIKEFIHTQFSNSFNKQQGKLDISKIIEIKDFACLVVEEIWGLFPETWANCPKNYSL
jgi:hypothetical protein